MWNALTPYYLYKEVSYFFFCFEILKKNPKKSGIIHIFNICKLFQMYFTKQTAYFTIKKQKEKIIK